MLEISDANGVVDTAPGDGRTNQQWQVNIVRSISDGNGGSTPVYGIVNVNSGLYLAASGGSVLAQASCALELTAMCEWEFVSVTDSTGHQYLTLSNLSGGFLDQPAGGGALDLTSGNTAQGQEWALSQVPGFWAYTAQGNVDNETGAPWFGSLGGNVTDVAGMAVTPDGQGYWLIESSGTSVTVKSYGDAKPNVPGFTLGSGCSVHGVANDYTAGFWVYDTCGNVFAEAGADNLLSQPHVCAGSSIAAVAAALPTGTQDGGYWLVCANGTVLSFGDAAPNITSVPTTYPIKGAVTDPAGGFWAYNKNGNVYARGSAHNYGDQAGTQISGMAAAPDGLGYWLVGQTSSGASTVYHFGDATGFAGNQITTTNPLAGAIGDPNI